MLPNPWNCYKVALDEYTRICYEGGTLGSPSEAYQRPWRYYNLTRRTQAGTTNTFTTERPEDGKPASTPAKIVWRWLNESSEGGEASIAKHQRYGRWLLLS